MKLSGISKQPARQASPAGQGLPARLPSEARRPGALSGRPSEAGRLIVASFLIFSCFLLTGCLPKKNEEGQLPQQATPVPTKPLEQSIGERPYVNLVPTADGHWINLEVTGIQQGTKSIDYELVYFAGDLVNKVERGVAGSVDLKGEKSISRKILFGSESCTVKCKYRYDENVSEGSLTLKVHKENSTDKYESAYRLQKGSEGKEGLTTGDGNFKFVANNLSSNAYFLTISTLGVPSLLPGVIAANPYGIFPAVNSKGMVSFKTTEQTAKIYFWNNNKWEELDSSFADGWVTAPVAKTGVFALVK